MKSFSDNKLQNPLSDWYEYSKKVQWRRAPLISTVSSSAAAVPSIMKRMNDNFTNSTTAPTNVASKLYEQWLVPRVNRQPYASSEWPSTSEMATSSDGAETKGFNSIASSDNSLWLLHSSSDDMMLSEQPSRFDVSPWLLQSDKEMTVPLGQDYSEWLVVF